VNRKGITLIELLVSFCASAILIAGIYKIFISQQHTFIVQDQIADLQQNVRLAINRMTREIRMTNFGRPHYINSDGSYDDTFFTDGGGMYGKYGSVVTPGGGGTSVTVVEAYQTVTTLSAPVSSGTTISVNDVSGFTTAAGAKGYISINGTESHHISHVHHHSKTLTFPGWDTGVKGTHQAGEPVYLVQAITYSHGIPTAPFRAVPGDSLLRNDNLGSGPQAVADNIDSIQFRNPDGSIPLNPSSACMQVAITVRTNMADPDYKVSGGYRKRTLTSNIQMRNLLY